MEWNLQKKLRIKAQMIMLGERIAWGSETELMMQAAQKIDELESRLENLASYSIVEDKDVFDPDPAI